MSEVTKSKKILSYKVTLEVNVTIPDSVDSFEIIESLQSGMLPTELFAKFEDLEEVYDYDSQEFLLNPVELRINDKVIYTHNYAV